MTENKKAEVFKFVSMLHASADNEQALLLLAQNAIATSHDKRTFSERRSQDLRVNPTSINLGSAIGTSHAVMNNNLSTNDKLYMIMNKYIKLITNKNPKMNKDKALDRFCTEFASRFPEEFGAKKKLEINPQSRITPQKANLSL